MLPLANVAEAARVFAVRTFVGVGNAATMGVPRSEPNRAVSAVRSFVQHNRSDILALWRRRAGELSASADLTVVRLVDHVPELLDQLSDIADEIAADGRTSTGFETARRHALDRLVDGFAITDVIEELSVLRGCILEVWDRSGMGELAHLRSLDLAIDRAITVSVARYAEASVDDRYKQVAAERERALAKLESLLAASPIGIAFVDRDLRFARINDALAEVNGRPAAEHIGRTINEVLPAVASRLEPLLRGVLDTGEPVRNLEITKDGETVSDTRWFVANYFPVRSASGAIVGVGGMVLEVTDARRAQESLQAETTRLTSIIEHAPAAIWVKDHAGRVLLANNRLAEALGHPLEDVVGHRSSEILPLGVATQHQAHDDTVMREGQAIEVEEVVPSASGERTFLSVKFPIPGSPPMVGAIATDITERKRLEHELRAAVRTREDLLAVVSHDLRNPLAALQLSSSLLLAEHAGDVRMRRHLDVIHRSCGRMESLIDDLLDVANIRAGRFRLELRREEIAHVLNEAVDLQEPLATEKGVRLSRRYDLDDVEVMCDRARIIQVFANLIGNAVKFCRSGDMITITGTRSETFVEFAIADNGPGIAPEVVPHLFDAYFSSPEHVEQGSGLGLYIVRSIVESHGGRVSVSSQPGSGATFTFTLPLAPARSGLSPMVG